MLTCCDVLVVFVESYTWLSTTCQHWLDIFILHLQLERGLSAHTVSDYQRQLRDIAKTLHLHDWSSITPVDVKRVMANAKLAGHKPRSIALRLSALRTFCQYLIEQKQLFSNPVEGVSAPKQGKPLPKQLSVDEMQQLLSNDAQSSGDEGIACRAPPPFSFLFSLFPQVLSLTVPNTH